MKKSIFLICIVFTLFTLLACNHENSFESLLFRTTNDPFSDVPVAESFKTENTIYLNWSEDNASDCFYLMRSIDAKTLDFACIYEGTNTSYTDINIEPEKKYIYRLDKKRGTKLFKGEQYAYGISFSCRKDNYEDNDLECNATFLQSVCEANVICIKYENNSEPFLDYDWYYIELPAQRYGEIIITQDNLSNDGDSTNLMIMRPCKDPEPVRHNIAITIQNTGTATNKFYFKIYPATTNLSQNFSTVFQYKISLNKIYS